MRTAWDYVTGKWSRGSITALGWRNYNYLVMPLVWYGPLRVAADTIASAKMVHGMGRAGQ